MADLTPVANTGRMQKDLILELEADGEDGAAYQKHVSNIQFAPSNPSPVIWQGGTPDAQLIDQGPAGAWTANVTLIQDWDNPDSLCNFLHEHAGEKAAIRYKPSRVGTAEFLAEVTLAAPQIGGAVNAFNESTVAMASTKPVKAPVAP